MVKRLLQLLVIWLIVNIYFSMFASAASSADNSDQKCDVSHYIADIEAVYPHDKSNFTQGLSYQSGMLYESTGLYGRSSIIRYGLDRPVKPIQRKMAPQFFGEGMAIVDNKLVQLTYKKGIGFVYDKKTLQQIDTFQYNGEGWGLAYDGRYLIMSDGTPVLRYLDAEKFGVVRELEVKRCEKPLHNLNELEFIDGRIFANIWRSQWIAVIDPASGNVVSEVDLNAIAARYRSDPAVDVLNGIAWDQDNKRLFITGKLWPHLYQITLKETVK